MRVRVREMVIGALVAIAVAPALSATAAIGAPVDGDHLGYADAITPNDPGYPAEWGVVGRGSTRPGRRPAARAGW